jgi:3-methyladenine DNA glycosylase AlkC
MSELPSVIATVSQVRDGFKPIREQADLYLATHPGEEGLGFAHELYASDRYQARMMATIMLGRLSARHPEAFHTLRTAVAQDSDWRTQEMLAMAFDMYCKDSGYEETLPVIRDWLTDPNHNVRRAVSEGLRIWTHRPYFKEHPGVAIELLASLKNDDHEYVRKSAGNALRDISRFHKDLVAKELQAWDLTDKRIADTYQYAARFVAK